MDAAMVCSNPRSSSIHVFSKLHNLITASSSSKIPFHHHPFTALPSTNTTFTWDQVFKIPQFHPNHSSSLKGFRDKVHLNNRNPEKQYEFMPFVIEEQIVGYVHHGFADHLREFKDVFILNKDDRIGNVTLHQNLRTPEDKTRAVADVIRCLGNELIPGIRNELYPVIPFHGAPAFFALERAAAPYFGIKAYGVHMNGYTERDGNKHLWVGKRSNTKQTYPGMLDHLVAGGLPHGISCEDNIIKECEEEAGIPSSIAAKARPVGAVSYIDINGFRYKRDVLFCYDLKLPESFQPQNQDGEVDSFKLIPIPHVSNIIRQTHFFKANCSLVIIDFLFRHGYIKPEDFGYLKLLQSLRNGDCS